MKIFYVDLERPWREISVQDVKIIECKKRVWAEFSNGKRRLLGASVFFTIESARRCQKAILIKQMSYAKYRSPYAYSAMESRLKLDYLH